MIERKMLRNLDVTLLLAIASLVSVGLVMIFSATHGLVDPAVATSYLVRQTIAVGLGLLLITWSISVDYRILHQGARLVYGGSLALLILVLVLGETVSGTTGWISFGPLNFQPAELAKLGLIVQLAALVSRWDDHFGPSWADVAEAIGYAAAPIILVLLQPDLGTAMVFVGILLGVLYVGGVSLGKLTLLIGLGAVVGVGAFILSYAGLFPVLQPYQLDRILVFLNPYADPSGAGWNVIQSMIAIGSGGFFGQGLFSGSQTQLSFLPARHTDFIFSVIGEELGFLGAVLVLALYFLLIQRILKIAAEARDRLGAVLATGVLSMFVFHLVINVGMTLGVMPVTGIPLPFVSYGASSLVTNLLAAGIILSVGMRRKKILF